MRYKGFFSFLLAFVMLFTFIMPVGMFAEEYLEDVYLEEKIPEYTENEFIEDPVVEENTGDPVIEENTGDPVIEENTGDPVVEENTGDPVVEENTGDPVIEENTEDLVIEKDNEHLLDEASSDHPYEDVIEENDTFQTISEDLVSVGFYSGNASSLPVITTEPADVEVAENSEVTLTVEATNATSYRWYYSPNGGTSWNYVPTGWTGSATASLTFAATASRANNLYRVEVKNDEGRIFSRNVRITLLPIITIDDISYERITSTTCRVIAYSGSAASITVLSEVEGMSVIEIGQGAFKDKSFIQSVSLPNSIQVIGKEAFKNCSNLHEMTTHD